MQDFEKLAAFYLGKEHDLGSGKTSEEVLLYDARDLTTHGVCVGMTGSGKTGLCVSLIEEAAIDGIPVIAVDPKGDLGNLMLTFPDLQGSEFEPWIDAGEASRKEKDVAAFAQDTAALWKRGLEQWGQSGERIRKFKDACEINIYTPGGSSGIPLTVLKSFNAPSKELLQDKESFLNRVQAAVSGLLALLGIDADPVKSREHILLSNVLTLAWQYGDNLDLSQLIRSIQKPPFDKIGVIDLESFYPENERFDLAMKINGLLASPSFATWLEGEHLDISSLLYGPNGKPRIAILSISHLSESERMFFVTILLNEILSWVRTQSGTSSLRTLLYMDEIYGYFPPSANPPSKKPMLTLLKQARAYGLGVLLATQNPVDLDYKGLSNTGTWFIGRLQTERDKMRVLDGLEGANTAAGSSFNRQRMQETLAGLGSRVFLMNNVHDDEPVIFHTRWALSYLRGPLTRDHIKKLMKAKKEQLSQKETLAQHEKQGTVTQKIKKSDRPMLPPQVPEYFVPIAKQLKQTDRIVYRPTLAGVTKLHYISAKAKIDDWKNYSVFTKLDDEAGMVNWEEAEVHKDVSVELDKETDSQGVFASIPAIASSVKQYKTWEKELTSHLYQSLRLKVFSCAKLKLISKPSQSEEEFRGQIKHAAREKRDQQMDKIKEKFGKRVSTIQDRIRRAEARIEKEKEQYKSHRNQTLISIGGTLLGALFGRRRSIGGATTAMRRASRTAGQKGDIVRAKEELEAQQIKLSELEQKLQHELDNLEEIFDPDELEIQEFLVKPRKSDITIYKFGLCWVPWKVSQEGIAEKAS